MGRLLQMGLLLLSLALLTSQIFCHLGEEDELDGGNRDKARGYYASRLTRESKGKEAKQPLSSGLSVRNKKTGENSKVEMRMSKKGRYRGIDRRTSGGRATPDTSASAAYSDNICYETHLRCHALSSTHLVVSVLDLLPHPLVVGVRHTGDSLSGRASCLRRLHVRIKRCLRVHSVRLLLLLLLLRLLLCEVHCEVRHRVVWEMRRAIRHGAVRTVARVDCVVRARVVWGRSSVRERAGGMGAAGRARKGVGEAA